jgi:FKBP-type peptidyl-prolyl cis-trans isomerase
LTNKGIDFRALRDGKDVEFEFDQEGEDTYNLNDENDNEPIDYKKLFQYRNMDVINGGEEEEDDDERRDNQKDPSRSKSTKTPFEILKSKMVDVTPKKDKGVFKRILIPGSGMVIPLGSRVRIHYNGYFEMNDEPIDSTYLRNKTFEFKLGVGDVVAGLDVAVSTMKKYEKAQFIFESEYYLGKYGCEPRVPKNTAVLFEIEVISFIEANAYDQYQASSEEQQKKLTMSQMLQICNCLREVTLFCFLFVIIQYKIETFDANVVIIQKVIIYLDSLDFKFLS